MANFLNYLQPHVEGGSDSSNSVFFFLIRQWSRDKDTAQCIHICKGHTQSVDTLAVDSSQTKVNRLHLTKKIVVSYWFCFMLFGLNFAIASQPINFFMQPITTRSQWPIKTQGKVTRSRKKPEQIKINFVLSTLLIIQIYQRKEFQSRRFER